MYVNKGSLDLESGLCPDSWSVYQIVSLGSIHRFGGNPRMQFFLFLVVSEPFDWYDSLHFMWVKMVEDQVW